MSLWRLNCFPSSQLATNWFWYLSLNMHESLQSALMVWPCAINVLLFLPISFLGVSVQDLTVWSMTCNWGLPPSFTQPFLSWWTTSLSPNPTTTDNFSVRNFWELLRSYSWCGTAGSKVSPFPLGCLFPSWFVAVLYWSDMSCLMATVSQSVQAAITEHHTWGDF